MLPHRADGTTVGLLAFSAERLQTKLQQVFVWHFVERACSVDSDRRKCKKRKKKATPIMNAKPLEVQPLLPPYEKTQSETWHVLCWIRRKNDFHQKSDYSTS